MVSVTPDIAASPSFQAPPPRAKADPSPSTDSFASLVDSNATAAANNNDRAQEASPPPAAPERRSAPARRDDPPADDRAPPRDAKTDKPGRNDVAERNVAAADQAETEKPAKDGSREPAKTRKAADKAEESNTPESTSSDDAAAAESAEDQVAADQPGAEMADAIAAAITVVATDVQAPVKAPTTPHSDGGPLAIAAAAIAASTAATEAATTPGPAPAAADTAKVAVIDIEPAVVKASAGEAIARNTGEDAVAVETMTPEALAATMTAPRPVASKPALAPKAPAAGEAAASSGETDASIGATDAPTADAAATPAAPITEQAVTAKPAVRNALAESARPEATGAQAPAATATHLNPATPHDAAPGQSNAQPTGLQGAGTFQPLVQAPLTASQPSFTVSAATQSAAVPLSGLAMEIAASLRSGKSRFEIRLDPAELGRIDVRIDVDRHGQVTSHLTVEKPETLSMLRQDAPQLQRALNDAGLSTGDGGLQFSLRDQSSSGQNGNQSNPNAQRLIVAEEETVPAAVAGSYGRMLSASGGVDIRV